jgi:hypothetical protein
MMTLAWGRGASPEDEADRLRARFEERDARQIGELTEDARRVQEDLAPVLKEMSEFLPADGPPAE